ncbi:MAG: hypothetical protein KDD82_05085, partial [Planctomycetes bacterium]|nr:hypothetical protein [Planctomycetota bacterium]
MSDRRLRELEQAWLATRDPVLEQQLVQGRLRAGSLPQPRLLLAAYAGSTAALQVLGAKGFAEEPNLRTWVRGLGQGRLARYPEQVRASTLLVARTATYVGCEWLAEHLQDPDAAAVAALRSQNHALAGGPGPAPSGPHAKALQLLGASSPAAAAAAAAAVVEV